MDESKLDLSVVIIAHNEEANLGRALASLPRGAEVVVLDSGSTDATQELARRHGARVFERPFTNFAEQKNAAIAHATRGWVLSLDSDEELDPALRDALTALVTTNAPDLAKAYRIERRLVFMGRVMRHGKTTDHPLRLFRRGAGSFVGTIHEEFHPNAGVVVERLPEGVLFHYSYRDLTDYFARFNRYTSAIAGRHAAAGRRAPLLTHVLRPWSEFIIRYFLRLGFLDGYPGYTYALISSLYTYVKYAKLHELERSRNE